MTPAAPTLEHIPLDLIDPGFNFRSDLKLSAEFKESVRVEGVRVPILVVKVGNRYRVIGGHRRLHAAREAGLKVIPALVHVEMPEVEEKALGLLENLAREGITFYDTFTGIVALDDLGMKGNVIAPKLGLSASMVSQYLSLTKLIPEGMEVLKAGTLGPTKLFEVASLPADNQLAKLDFFLLGGKRDEGKAQGPRKFRTSGSGVEIRVPLVSGATVTVAGEGVSMDEALEAVQEAAKQLKAAIAKGITAKHAQGYWTDLAANA